MGDGIQTVEPSSKGGRQVRQNGAFTSKKLKIKTSLTLQRSVYRLRLHPIDVGDPARARMSNDRAIPVVSNIPSAEEDLTPSNIATIFNPLTCIKRGHCDVGSDALRLVKSHRLYYELHGSRDPTAEKVLLIMGLNNSCFACVIRPLA